MSPSRAETTDLSRPLRVAVLGYGLAGRAFHAPLIAGVPGLELACICSSQSDKAPG